MKKTKLSIAILIIVSLLATSFAPLTFAVDEISKAEETSKTEETNGNTTQDENANEGTAEETSNWEKYIDILGEDTFQKKVKEKYGEPVIVVNGETKTDTRLDFSSEAMPQLQIKVLKNGKLENLAENPENGIVVSGITVANDGTFEINKLGSTVVEFAYKYPKTLLGTTKRTIRKVNIVVASYNPAKYDITLDEDLEHGVSFNKDKKLLTIQKESTSNSFRYENGTGILSSDVKAVIDNAEIAEIVEGSYNSKKVHALSVGETKVTLTGNSIKDGSQTFSIKVVENLYQYDKEQDGQKPSTGNNTGSGSRPTEPSTGNNTGSGSRPTKPSTGDNTGSSNKPSTGDNSQNDDNSVVDDKTDDDTKQDEDKKDENQENNNDDIIPDDFEFTQYDDRGDVNTDYTKLNEELLKNTDTLEVTVEGNHVVKADVFKTLKKYPNKKLLINSTASGIGKISWTFDSNTITNTNIDFKPSAQFSADKLASIHSDKANEGIFMDLAHNGELPGKASVSLWLGDELAQKYIDKVNEPIYLYYYNPTKNDYEYVGNAKMVDYGTVGFELEHCSIYLLSTSKLENKTTRPLDGEPKTGVQNYLIVASTIAVISLAGIIILKKHGSKKEME